MRLNMEERVKWGAGELPHVDGLKEGIYLEEDSSTTTGSMSAETNKNTWYAKFMTPKWADIPALPKHCRKIKHYFSFPGMRAIIEKFVKEYDLCHRSIPVRHKPFGHLQPLEVPEKP